MKFYFDENFSPYLIKGLKYIQSGRNAENAEILSIKDEFNAGCKDEEWIPVVASKNGVVITQDININRTKYLHALFTKHKLCVFYFRTPKNTPYKFWEWVQVVINHWNDIKNISHNGKKPFAYQIQPRSSKPVEMSY